MKKLILAVVVMFVLPTSLSALQTVDRSNHPSPELNDWLEYFNDRYFKNGSHTVSGAKSESVDEELLISSFLYNMNNTSNKSSEYFRQFNIAASNCGKSSCIVIVEHQADDEKSTTSHYLAKIYDNEKVFESKLDSAGKGRASITLFAQSVHRFDGWLYLIVRDEGEENHNVFYELYETNDKELHKVWSWRDYYEIDGGHYFISKISFGKSRTKDEISVYTTSYDMIAPDIPILPRGDKKAMTKYGATAFKWEPSKRKYIRKK